MSGLEVVAALITVGAMSFLVGQAYGWYHGWADCERMHNAIESAQQPAQGEKE